MEGAFFMGQKQRFSIEEKLKAIEDYIYGKRGKTQICYDMQIHHSSFEQWLRKYQLHGRQGLITISHNKFYPEELKVKAVRDYCEGQGSLSHICSKYDITTLSLLRKWIKKYNGHEPVKSQNSTGGKIMTGGRKTTYEERVEIVSFCIANNENYQLSSEKYQVSYQQVYTWVKKYQKSGPEALADRRGKHKNSDDMTETEKLAAQVKLLEAENKRLQLEVGFLKKLKEVERRRAGKTNIQLLKNTPRKPGSR